MAPLGEDRILIKEKEISEVKNIMRCNKNITLKLESISSHFTGKRKIITLSLLILMLSFANIILNATSISALSYESNVGIGFSFNPTLTISFSSSDLVISNLTPGTTSDSNDIVVSVSTNAAYGYTLSVGANSDSLVHSNNSNVFSSIDTDTSLSSLTTDNTWGYSYKNNLASTPTWSNYSGLSTDTSKVLFNTDSNTNSSIGFKIGAKASSTQASGEYTNTINFIAISKPIPKTIEDIAYMQTFGELNTTDLNSVKSSMVLNSAYILKDIRDEKEYYVTRLEDSNVWMTQNLDLDLSSDKPLTSNDTDLNDTTSAAYQNGYTVNNNIIEWTPATSANTIDFENTTVDGWQNSYNEPYSANKTDNSNTGHASLGNYYNWSAAIASNNSSTLINDTAGNISNNPKNSICPKGWRLPTVSNQSGSDIGSTNEFARLNYLYNDNRGNSDSGLVGGSPKIVRGGVVDEGELSNIGATEEYWSSTVKNSARAGALYSGTSFVTSVSSSRKICGASVRCLAR